MDGGGATLTPAQMTQTLVQMAATMTQMNATLTQLSAGMGVRPPASHASPPPLPSLGPHCLGASRFPFVGITLPVKPSPARHARMDTVRSQLRCS
jgi:hypothetical protein